MQDAGQRFKKYRAFRPVRLARRAWPSRVLRQAPIWCSVDLRDGNQALAVPMNVSQKLELFQALVQCGFKEIEVGFPSASDTEFTFNRRLIEEERAPKDVWLQVLVQARCGACPKSGPRATDDSRGHDGYLKVRAPSRFKACGPNSMCGYCGRRGNARSLTPSGDSLRSGSEDRGR